MKHPSHYGLFALLLLALGSATTAAPITDGAFSAFNSIDEPLFFEWKVSWDKSNKVSMLSAGDARFGRGQAVFWTAQFTQQDFDRDGMNDDIEFTIRHKDNGPELPKPLGEDLPHSDGDPYTIRFSNALAQFPVTDVDEILRKTIDVEKHRDGGAVDHRDVYEFLYKRDESPFSSDPNVILFMVKGEHQPRAPPPAGSPIAEPSTAALLGVGLAGFVFLRVRSTHRYANDRMHR